MKPTQELFNYMKNEHGVTLMDTDMLEIVRIVNAMPKQEQEPIDPQSIINAKAVVITDKAGHFFFKGTIVTILDYEKDRTYKTLDDNGVIQWLFETDFELIT